MKKKYVVNILLAILTIVLIFSITKLILFYREVYINKKLNSDLINEAVEINKIIDGNEEIEKISIDFTKLSNTNKDVVGWIRFNNDKVNSPFVQSSDNSYYINHSFNKQKNSLGTIFMDYRNNTLKDRNVVIYGHNSVSGTMFGSLKQALKKEFFDTKGNEIIEIIDLNNNIYHYEIFSIYTITKEEYYITTDFESDDKYLEFLNTIKKRSIIKFDTELTALDRILTLSTCNGAAGTSTRLAIHAKLVD